MKKRESSLQAIYTTQIGDAVSRLESVEEFMRLYSDNSKTSYLEAAILQLRKALEVIAIAAIAPDKNQYEAFRKSHTQDPDFTKDYHAAKIFDPLSRVNPDFYPLPLLPAAQQPDGSWHFGKKETGLLSKKQFERTYDRLGKYLHATNPWGTDKNLQNLVADIPTIVGNARGLIHLHARFIRTQEFHGVWVVEATSSLPRIITAVANGPYAVQRS
jgi:hypothetical protein